jgi:acetyl-CoA carboxylase carboxyltransferase component
MRAAIDQDGGHLERFRTMADAETGIIWDAHIGGHAVSVIGFESRPIPRRGRIPMDGPDTWSGGTLFPQSSKKVARGINAASGNRPIVVLANLSGFDGSPESMRKLQLEYGAEIGRAIVNFEGPVVFVVVGRYHGGAYVVFSKGLNRNLTAMALEGTYASVIGGAPAAAVVFPRDVRARANKDPRIVEAQKSLAGASPSARPRLREELNELLNEVTLEKQGEVAQEFDAIHTVHRATEVGSLDAVIQPHALRPAIIDVLDKARKKAESAVDAGVRAVS